MVAYRRNMEYLRSFLRTWALIDLHTLTLFHKEMRMRNVYIGILLKCIAFSFADFYHLTLLD